MNHKRLLLECNIPLDCRGLKTEIKEFLASKNIGCRVQKRLNEDNGNYYTNLQVESSMHMNIFDVLNELKVILQRRFPEVTDRMFEWNSLEHENPFVSASIIKTTEPALSREDSSGLVDNVDDLAPKDSISQAASMSSTMFLKAVEFAKSMLQLTGKIHVDKTVVKIEATNGKCEEFDITGKSSMSMKEFLSEVTLSQELGLKAPSKKIYSRDSEGKYAVISAFSCLLHKHKYYVFTDIDELPVNSPSSSSLTSPERGARVPVSPETKGFATMQEFYGALRSVDCDDDDIKLIDEVFKEQRIKVSVLSTLTDYDLKDYGLKQGGLRKAILKVLGKE